LAMHNPERFLRRYLSHHMAPNQVKPSLSAQALD
jgi:hypothetical protein